MIKQIPIFEGKIFILLMIIFLNFATYSNGESKTVNDFIDSGIEDSQNGKFNQAISKFNKALNIQPQNYYAYLNRGVAYRILNDHKNAISDLNKCIELEPNNPEAYFELAFFSSFRGDFEEAIQYYSKSIELDPNFSGAYGTLAIMRFMLGDYEKAIEILNLGISINPNKPILYIVRGQVLEIQGRCAEAIKDFKKGMSFDPKRFNTNINIAWILSTCPDVGVRNGQKALNMLNDSPDIEEGASCKSLAAAHAELGDFEKAIFFQKKAITKTKEIKISGKMEEMYYKKELKKNFQQLKSYKQKIPWMTKKP